MPCVIAFLMWIVLQRKGRFGRKSKSVLTIIFVFDIIIIIILNINNNNKNGNNNSNMIINNIIFVIHFIFFNILYNAHLYINQTCHASLLYLMYITLYIVTVNTQFNPVMNRMHSSMGSSLPTSNRPRENRLLFTPESLLFAFIAR